MAAPGIAAFGDGSHAPGATGIAVQGGGFGAFPGHVWIYQNADRTGSADELTVTAWNGVEATVNIPASLTNTAGTRYLFLQRADLAWSNAFGFTLEAASGVTLTPVDISQAEAVDAVGMSQDHQLAPADITQLEVLDAVGLTQTHQVVVGDIDQAQVLDAAGVTQTHVLGVDDIAQLQTLDDAVLVVEGVLVPSDIAQIELLGAVLMSQDQQLSVADIAQAEALDAVGMVVTHLLTPAAIGQLQLLDAVALQQTHLLGVVDIGQLQVLDLPSGAEAGFLRAGAVRFYPRLHAEALVVRPS